MEYTENLTLALVGDDDLFDEAYLNANFEKIDAAYAELSQRSGGGSAPALASAVAEGVVGTVGTAEMVYGMDIDLMGASWEQGSIYDNGNNFNSTARIRTPDYLDLSNASDIFYSGFTVVAEADKKLQYTFNFYDSEKKLLTTSTNKDWLDSGALTTCGTASAPSYVRVVLRHADNSDMTPDVLTSARLKILA
jgi:hypothetical protein